MQKEFGGCDLVEIGVDSFKRPKSYVNILRFVGFLKREHIDIVQTHFVEGNKVGVIAARLSGIKAIISTRRNQGYWHNFFELRFLNLLNRWVSLFVANSQSTRRWAVATEGISDSQVEVIHNGINLDQFVNVLGRDDFRLQLGIPADSPVVVIVANLRPVKGIDLFIRAADAVIQKCPNARFIIVGEGGERPKLERLVSDFGIRQSVFFLGRRIDIPNILSGCDVGVLTSHSESFSNTIVEYLAAGLPVVCTDVGGSREAVADGINGFVVKPGDYEALACRLLEILNMDRSAIREVSRQMAQERFSLSAMISASEELYVKIRESQK